MFKNKSKIGQAGIKFPDSVSCRVENNFMQVTGPKGSCSFSWHEDLDFSCQDNLIKIYSFFDPRVFEAFDRFVKKLGQYFAANSIAADLWGIRCGFFQDGQYKSFMEDSSKTFESAFARFLQGKKSAEQVLSPIEEKQYAFAQDKKVVFLNTYIFLKIHCFPVY